ncbi:MAG: hypothetical protein M1365_16095 [Actinobacteria bacterium]|nr:hypothetical protein [Actinomycetota bacterium]
MDNINISEYIRFGLNTIEFTYEVPDYEKNIRNNSWLEHCLYADPLIENIFIIGDILCLKNGIIDGTNTIFLGDLCKQGFEYYSGMATFSKYFLLSDDKVKRIKNIEVETLCNDAFSISINSYPEKISIFSPTIFKINGELTPGSNILNLKIANTLANVIEDPKPWGIKTIKFF